MADVKDIKDIAGSIFSDFFSDPDLQIDGGDSASPAPSDGEEGSEPEAAANEPVREENEEEDPFGEPKDKTDAAPGEQKKEEEKAQPRGDEEDPRSGMEQLNELIGLTGIKKDVEEMVGLAKMQKMREEAGMKPVPMSLHLVFSGNPGTGKTTVARILAKLYKEIGILSKGQLIEVDRSGLVAGYVGQTATKTLGKVKEALGGILFIDEAYTLVREGNDFGQEAIDTILKAMEDYRKDLIVIVAGYTELMKTFIESNPGLKSRFNKYMEFPDYTADELVAIFRMRCDKYDYVLDEGAWEAAEEKIRQMEAEKGENFANARDVRNLFERIITNQAKRLSLAENPDHTALTTILREDVTGEAPVPETEEASLIKEDEPDANASGEEMDEESCSDGEMEESNGEELRS